MARTTALPAEERLGALVTVLDYVRTHGAAKRPTLVEATGTVLAFDLPGREGQREWLRKQASRAGADLDGSALTRLLVQIMWDLQAARFILGTNARKRRGLSTMIWRSTSSFAPAAFNFGTNTVSVLA